MKKLSIQPEDYPLGFTEQHKRVIAKINICIDEHTAVNNMFDFEFTPINYALNLPDMMIIDEICDANNVYIMFVSFHGLCLLNKAIHGDSSEYDWASWKEENMQESFVPYEYAKKYWRDFLDLKKRG